MKDYLTLFMDSELLLDKYTYTKTLNRIKDVTQFCGCDYTNMYHPLFLYTRYFHSLVVAHMTWHFTHDKKQTIAAYLHDVGTPCFAHCIDYVLGDYINQESSEKKITDIILEDKELLSYLKDDHIDLEELENQSPKLCTDRLDGVLHTCYIWLHTNTLEEIKEVYDDITVLSNELKEDEIGFKHLDKALKFVEMNYTYAKELQGNTDKFIMQYISEIVKKSVRNNFITLSDLYSKKEQEIVNVFATNFSSWKNFNQATSIINTMEEPDNFYISFDTKKRNVIPLVKTDSGNKRITEISERARKNYAELEDFHDAKYAYVKTIKRI